MKARVGCTPVAYPGDHVVEGSKREHCAICGQQVWVAPTTYDIARDYPDGLEFICLDCLPGVISTDPEPHLMPPTRAQRAELIKHWRSRQ